MPRIYHLIKGLGRGGAETLLVQNLRISRTEEFQYRYGYFLPWKDALAPSLEELGSHVDCFKCSSRLGILMAARSVAQTLRGWNADILHCHLPLAGIVGRVAGRLAKVPVVYTEHNRLERYHPLTKRMSLLTWRWQRLVIAVSAEVSASVHEHADGTRPVRVVLNGVDTVFFRRDAVSQRVREELEISATAPVVGTVAVFRVQKRLQDWLVAAKIVLGARPDARFILVGDGPIREELVLQIQELGIGSAVHLVGLREDVRPYLAAMDVFMLSSLFEGLPVALLEAMSMECAVVSTSVGGIPEVIRSGSNGILVPPKEPPELAQAALAMISDLPTARRMGEEARATVVRDFGIVRMTRELEDLYDEILQT
jgi:glycosyltransferase involved in cell wall biosynthesis